MKNLSWILLLSIISLSGWNCTEGGGSTTAPAGTSLISGTIDGAGDMKLFLDKMNFDNSTKVFGSTEIDNGGSFSMKIDKGLDQGIYRLRIGTKKAYMTFDGSESKVTIKGDLSTMDQNGLTFTGSNSANQFQNNMKEIVKDPSDVEKTRSIVENMPNAVASAFMAINFYRERESLLNSYKTINDKLTSKLPDSKYAKDFTSYLSGLEQKIAVRKANAKLAVGEVAPDIVLPGLDGKTRKLSDLKGKVVLIDFWASWCGPCRRSNPHVVEAYKKYNKKGFEVFSVSLDGIHPRMLPSLQGNQAKMDQQLDSAKRKWKAAIDRDKLTWDSHVSDLKHWNSPVAKMYNVRGIPHTYLLDREGKIVLAAVNPLSPDFDLEAEVKKLL